MTYSVYIKAHSTNGTSYPFTIEQPCKSLTPTEFETYGRVDAKLSQQFKSTVTERSCYLGSKDFMRWSICLAEPGMFLRYNNFCTTIKTATGEDLADEVKFRSYVKPSQIHIPDHAWLKFSAQEGRLFLVDMSDDITFIKDPRQNLPSASKQTDRVAFPSELHDRQ